MKLDREITRADVSGALVGLQLHLWKADYEASLKLLEKKGSAIHPFEERDEKNLWLNPIWLIDFVSR